MVAVWSSGCSRAYHRTQADGLVSGILGERDNDVRWAVPPRGLLPDRRSRMFDATDPDRGVLPPDDPAAHRYMLAPYRFRGWRGWDRRGQAPAVEQPAWLACLPRDARGAVPLGPDTVMRLALLHSRDYQTRVEQVYFAALALTFQRFQLDAQWFAGTGANYLHAGSGGTAGNETNTLTVPSDVRVRQNLAWGGQVLADFANSFVWEFTGDDASFASSGLLVQMTQPLLRGAFRQIALEGLTQAERDVLYAVRDFARFRRVFYVDVTSQYLGLLAQSQQIRNQEFNLRGLERSLREHEELAAAGLVSVIQVDQIFQQYQGTRLSLLSSQLGLQTALDNFKVRMGLPPQLMVSLDQSMLAQFQLTDPRWEQLRADNETLFLGLLQNDEAPAEGPMRAGFESLLAHQALATQLTEALAGELSRWEERLASESMQLAAAGPSVARDTSDPRSDRAVEVRRQTQLAKRLRTGLADVVNSLKRDQKAAQQALAELAGAVNTPEARTAVWLQLRSLVGREFGSQLTDAFVIQNQVRVYLIELPVFGLAADPGVSLALANRLDLMNQRGLVVDAYRKVEVAGNALQAGLNVTGSANLLTIPGTANPLKFSSTANQYRLGLQFDSPITRRAERNAFRGAQIQYQQTRRQYMLTEDQIALAIRSQLRNLEVNRFQFDIARQTLVAAARQVDEAQITLRAGGQQADSSLTLFLLNAYNNLLGATNGLVSGWVSYEITRMNLFRDLEWMQVDAEGRWTNADDQFVAPRRPLATPSVRAWPAAEPVAPGLPAGAGRSPRSSGPPGSGLERHRDDEPTGGRAPGPGSGEPLPPPIPTAPAADSGSARAGAIGDAAKHSTVPSIEMATPQAGPEIP